MTTQARYIIPSLGNIWEKFGDLAWPMMRIFYGLFYIPHGFQKLFGWWGGDIARTAKTIEGIGFTPGIAWAYYIAILEVFGGILLVLGLWTRPVALLFAGFMFVGAFAVHMNIGYFWTARGMEMPLLLLLLALPLVLRGAGDYSLDKKIGREF